MPSRRDILRWLACSGGGRALPSIAQQLPMLQRRIPSSGESLPAIGLGSYQSFDVGEDRARRAALSEVLRLFSQAGAQVIDSSPMYGSSETVVGDLAAELGLREKLFLATKVWTSGREAGVRQMEESFAKLRSDRIELMQVHNLLDLNTHEPTLRRWKEQGRIRYLGITHYHDGAHGELERLVTTKRYDCVQFNYSLIERAAEQRLLPACAASATAVIINRPFAQAGLFGMVRGKEVPAWASEFDCTSWAQFFLKYILAHPAVTCVIPATSKPQHLADNLGAGLGRLPEAKMRARMVEFIRAI